MIYCLQFLFYYLRKVKKGQSINEVKCFFVNILANSYPLSLEVFQAMLFAMLTSTMHCSIENVSILDSCKFL